MNLKIGDTVGLMAPASAIALEAVLPAVRLLKSWGFGVELGKTIDKRLNNFSGTDDFRLSDLQSMLDNPAIEAIVFARGGYGCIRIIDRIDFTKFIKTPKWLVGFSDITVLHNHINQRFGIETIHATMPINFPVDGLDNASTLSLKNALTGNNLAYELTNKHPLNRCGVATGQVVGGNLSLIYALMGSQSELKTRGKILFIEDIGEPLYHLDRMMWQLRRANKLRYLAGLVVGHFSEMQDTKIGFGQDAAEIIAQAVETYKFPVLFDFPAGHHADNRALIFGRDAWLSVQKTEQRLVFEI